MKKSIVILFLMIFVFSDLFSEDFEGDIPNEEMEKIHYLYINDSDSALLPDDPLSGIVLNGEVEPFTETISGVDYTVYSLTNFHGIINIGRDLTTSIKNQHRGDCTRFATTGAIEMEVNRQYLNVYNYAIESVISNGGTVIG